MSFTVPQGEVLGFLGPNGAGKSTTMKMITGFLAPTAGTAIDLRPRHRRRSRSRRNGCIGYLPEGAPAYPDMTAGRVSRLHRPYPRLSRRARRSERIGRVVETDPYRRGHAPADRDPVEGLSAPGRGGAGAAARPAGADPRRADRRARPQPEIRDARHHRGDARRKRRSSSRPICSRRSRRCAAARSSSPAAASSPTARRPSSPRARAITTPCGSASPAAPTPRSRPSWRHCPGWPRSSRPSDAEGDALMVFSARRPPDRRRDRRAGASRGWRLTGAAGSSAAGSTTCSARSRCRAAAAEPRPIAAGLNRDAQHPDHLPPRAGRAISRRRSPMCSSSSFSCWRGC